MTFSEIKLEPAVSNGRLVGWVLSFTINHKRQSMAFDNPNEAVPVVKTMLLANDPSTVD